MRLKTDEGEYDSSISEKAVFKTYLSAMLYEPTIGLINCIKIVPIGKIVHRLAGLKIGKTSNILGHMVLRQPYVIEIGENCLIGGGVEISGHIIEDINKIIIKKIKIGNNCLIGNDSFIFGGAIIENDVILGARSLVLKNQVLKKGKMYGGAPAREIKKKQNK